MEGFKSKTLVLFFTCGVSLETWASIGNLGREIKPYNKLAQYFKKIYFVTYGGNKDFNFQEKLSENIEILPRRFFLPAVIYQFFIPLIYRRKLKEADIYKTNQMGAVIPALISKCIYRKRLVVRCGYEWLEFAKKGKKSFWKIMLVSWLEKIAYKKADRIILTSAENKKFVEDNFKNCSSKISIVPNYIDADKFKPTKTEKNDARVIFVGRLHEQKNLFNLIDAISRIKCELVIIGSGLLRDKLEYSARRIKLRVRFLGNIPNERLPEELNKARCFILPSLYEGCPKTLLEAMSCGLPCIGTNVEGIREIINHKENGYLCGTDANSIKVALEEVLGDKKLQIKIGGNARETILRKFDFAKIAEQEVNIYKTI